MRSDFIGNYNTQVSAKPNLNIIILSLTIVTGKLYGVPDALTDQFTRNKIRLININFNLNNDEHSFSHSIEM